MGAARSRSLPESAERILPSLPTDGGFGSVTGQHPGLVVEGHHSLSHRAGERIHITAGQIGSSDGAREELVAGEEDSLFDQGETAMAGSVARSVDHLQAQRADLDG